MADGISLFWSFGGLYFAYLNDVVVFGVTVLCYILGAFLISKVITYLVKVGSNVSFRKRGF